MSRLGDDRRKTTDQRGKLKAHLVDMLDLFSRKPDHDGAHPIARGNQAVMADPVDGVAHRRPADTEFSRQLGKVAARAGPIRHSLHQAVTELQFHDMATQLIVHTGKVLQSCAWRLAEEAMEPEEGEIPLGLDPMPERPSPVTQSEMDAGSIDLF